MGVIAPSSSGYEPLNIRWFRIRFHSAIMVRIHCARSGTSTPARRSTAIVQPSSLLNALIQSWRFISTSTCSVSRNSASFSAARCMYPMTGWARMMTSPSGSGTQRISVFVLFHTATGSTPASAGGAFSARSGGSRGRSGGRRNRLPEPGLRPSGHCETPPDPRRGGHPGPRTLRHLVPGQGERTFDDHRRQGICRRHRDHGTGTGTDTPVPPATSLVYDVDLRFMQGSFVAADGKMHEGTFGFV